MRDVCLFDVALPGHVRGRGFSARPAGSRLRRLMRARTTMTSSTPVSTLAAFLDAPTFGPLRTALGKAQHLRYKLFQKKRHEGAVLENICDMPVVVTPGVLNPRLMRTGAFFAEKLASVLP